MSEAYVEKARSALNVGDTDLVIEAMEQAIAIYTIKGKKVVLLSAVPYE